MFDVLDMLVPITGNLSKIKKDLPSQMRHNSFSTGLAKYKVIIFKFLVKYVIRKYIDINIFDSIIDVQHSTNTVSTVTDLTTLHAFYRFEIIHPTDCGVHLEVNLLSIPVKIVIEQRCETDRRK